MEQWELVTLYKVIIMYWPQKLLLLSQKLRMKETSTDSCQTQVTPVVTAFVDSSTSVLLQTAMVSVVPVDNSEEAINVRLLFDSGSQQSCISGRLRNRLRLPTVKTEKLLIKTFDDDSE